MVLFRVSNYSFRKFSALKLIQVDEGSNMEFNQLRNYIQGIKGIVSKGWV